MVWIQTCPISESGFLTEAKEPQLSYPSLKPGKGEGRFMPFPIALELCEMQTATSLYMNMHG